MLKKLFGSIALASIMLISACTTDTSVTAPEISSQRSISVTNNNRWQTWNINWYSQCTGRTYSGSYRIHFQSQQKQLDNGITSFVEHVNIAGGRLFDDSGNEYIFQNNGTATQYALPSGAYTVENTSSFKIISKGSGANEFVDVMLVLTWDGTNFTVTSANTVSCRGG